MKDIKKQNPKGSSKPASFVQEVKNKIVETVFGGSPKDDMAKELEEAKEEMRHLKAVKEHLKSKCTLLTKDFSDISRIEAEIKKISVERKRINEDISEKQEKAKALYVNKDASIKELEAAKARLKETLDEKRSVSAGHSSAKMSEHEINELKEKLTETRKEEGEMAVNLEEIEARFRFANANIDTLVVDSTTAQKIIEEADRSLRQKAESIRQEEGVCSSIDNVIGKLIELKGVKENAQRVISIFKSGIDKLKDLHLAISEAEKERSAIPKKVAELTAEGKEPREKDNLVAREKALALELETLKSNEKGIMREVEKNKAVLEDINKTGLEVKRLMIAAGLNQFAAGVDNESTDSLIREVEARKGKLAELITRQRNELENSYHKQSEKKAKVKMMVDELKKLMKDAERDKHDLELHLEKTRKVKDQTSGLCKSLEAKLREKSAALAEAVNIDMEVGKIESREADLVSAMKQTGANIDSLDSRINGILSNIQHAKDCLLELDEIEEFFREKINIQNKLERLKTAEKELVLSQEVAEKYEKEARRLKEIECEKALLEKKLVLINESELPMEVLESRVFEMEKEKLTLEKALEPFRLEMDFALEKRDNMEMDISFARDSLKRASERKKQLERKLEFITKESGSIQDIQERLKNCEKTFVDSERNIAEIQTRLNFTAATEDVAKERFQLYQNSLKDIEPRIADINNQIREKDAAISRLEGGTSGDEKKVDDAKAARIQGETNRTSLNTTLKKVTIECDAFQERINKLEAELKGYEEQRITAQKAEAEYDKAAGEKKKLDEKIASLDGEMNEEQQKLDDIQTEIEELNDKKRELMEESLASSSGTTVKSDKDQRMINKLRDERKIIRAKIKEMEAEIKAKRSSKKDSDNLDSLRADRDSLRKEIDEINAKIDAVKEDSSGDDATDVDKRAAELAKQIGRLDIEVLSLTKTIKKIRSKIEATESDLKELTDDRNEIELEIENMKKDMAPLAEIKKKLNVLEEEKDKDIKSLQDKVNEKDELSEKVRNVDKDMEIVLKDMEEAERALNRSKSEAGVSQKDRIDLKNRLDEAVKNRSNSVLEFNKTKAEMDSIMSSNRSDRQLLDQETVMAKDARARVEETKKQLSEAMAILTGKAGSVDNMRLELNSSAGEEKDAADRIKSLGLDLKAAVAAIEGIESNIAPKEERMKFITWANDIMKSKLEASRQRVELEAMSRKYKELEEVRDLYDTYNDLSKSKEHLSTKIGKLKKQFEIENELVIARQKNHEIAAEMRELNEKLEARDVVIKGVEEKYKAAQEDRVRIKGQLDETVYRFKSAQTKWGTIEDLSRVRESLESKIGQFNKRFGTIEKAGERLERMENEKIEFMNRIKSLETHCRFLEEEKRILEASLKKSRSEFEDAFAMLKRSTDEAKRLL